MRYFFILCVFLGLFISVGESKVPDKKCPFIGNLNSKKLHHKNSHHYASLKRKLDEGSDRLVCFTSQLEGESEGFVKVKAYKPKTITLENYTRTGIVKGCHDGDTCNVDLGKKQVQVRLHQVDAPEIDQPMGKESRDRLNQLVDGKQVTIKCDSYSRGRYNCDLVKDEESIGALMVEEGLAWDFKHYSKGAYQGIQQSAKMNHKGIWATKNRMSPFCWRHTGQKVCDKNPEFQP